VPPREWRLRIEDMLESIVRVNQYVQGMTFEQFAADPKTIDAVIRRLEILGEAARTVPAEICGQHPRIPWRDIRGMRNFVSHVYFSIRLEKIWDTLQNDLPPLEIQLRQVLEVEDT
jgi:uncharacterized protein with HEPN domain